MLHAGSHVLGLHPWIYATAIREARKGSSPMYSKFRPLSGVRWMFTAGPSRMSFPRARASSPIVSPYALARSVFNVAASPTPTGSHARSHPSSPRASSVRPDVLPHAVGPSESHRRGMPSRGIAAVVNFESACTSCSFSSTERRFSRSSTRSSTVWPCRGEPLPRRRPARGATKAAKANATGRTKAGGGHRRLLGIEQRTPILLPYAPPVPAPDGRPPSLGHSCQRMECALSSPWRPRRSRRLQRFSPTTPPSTRRSAASWKRTAATGAT